MSILIHSFAPASYKIETNSSCTLSTIGFPLTKPETTMSDKPQSQQSEPYPKPLCVGFIDKKCPFPPVPPIQVAATTRGIPIASTTTEKPCKNPHPKLLSIKQAETLYDVLSYGMGESTQLLPLR
jgi:hypothetical protein